MGGQDYSMADPNDKGLMWQEWVHEALTDRQWQALWHQVHGSTTKETARILGISANAVRLYRSRAIKRLRAVAQEVLRFDNTI